jgi:biotin synthase-like enzyme
MGEAAPRPSQLGIEPIGAEEARRLIRLQEGPELEALFARARAVRDAVHGTEIALCGIVNAKSGHCPEDCGFCQQSAHFEEAHAPAFPMLSAREIADQAKAAEAAGAREFSIVTSGTRVFRESELSTLEEALLKAITPAECLAAIAVYRLMMPAAHIFVMGGREVNLGEAQHRIFDAGADGTMVGNYLTSAGSAPRDVVEMIREKGYALRPTPEPARWAFRGEAPEGEAAWNRSAATAETKPSRSG